MKIMNNCIIENYVKIIIKNILFTGTCACGVVVIAGVLGVLGVTNGVKLLAWL
jgi:hypothetical protein